MMNEDVTPRLGLPMLMAGQAQKEMTHNEALLMLDTLVSGSVESLAIDVPPHEPVEGQCWIIGADPQGAWADHANALAAWA